MENPTMSSQKTGYEAERVLRRQELKDAIDADPNN